MFDIKVKELDKSFGGESLPYFQQSVFWGEFKALHGWTLKRFEISWTFTEEVSEEVHSCSNKENQKINTFSKTENVSVMIRSFAKGFLSLAYVPLYPSLPFKCTDERKLDDAIDGEGISVIDESPVTAETQAIEFAALLNETGLALKPFLPKNTICVRFDPCVEFDYPDERDDYKMGLKLVSFADRLKVRKSFVDIQPPDSTRIFLDGEEEEILNRMKNKWRYNIRLSEKKGVLIEKHFGNDVDFSEKLDVFYDLYRITAERDGIGIHPKRYYENLLKKSSEDRASGKDAPLVTLYLAKHEDDYLGAIITLFCKDESIYLYGCSSNVKRNLMPNFLLQWTAMKDAKEYGCPYYDMYGMPPTDDENHPMHGLYLFKTGFGGKNYHRIGSYDVRLKFLYFVATSGENIRAFWHKKIMKKIRGR
ncbi:MAG: peptidoglycan bridge formation glycyltransferase FemA/FemB family protein [Treponema sp.]|nr:peptidoglycan bridge formation glycyltransferase FemA/FemB family protein [Treponema sp.]